jgi:hypothetical protein
MRCGDYPTAVQTYLEENTADGDRPGGQLIVANLDELDGSPIATCYSGRTVGVITNVETMQRQLSIGIRVIRSDTGSRLEFPLLR